MYDAVMSRRTAAKADESKIRIDAKTFQEPVWKLAETMGQKVSREGPGLLRGPAYVSEDIFLMVRQAIATYNSIPHESLNNVSLNDVYAGRKEAILQRRKEKKRLTLERRKQYNLNMKNKGPDHHGVANSG